jgi:hypothetical protein
MIPRPISAEYNLVEVSRGWGALKVVAAALATPPPELGQEGGLQRVAVGAAGVAVERLPRLPQ